MKNLSYLIVIIITILIILNYNERSADLEIYTKENIYYIQGLKVTNEANDQVLIFNDKESLKNYISDVTAKDLE